MKIEKDSIYYTKEEFDELFKRMKLIGESSEGICKRFNNRKVIKLFNELSNEEYEKDQILKYKKLKNLTYIFADKVFYIDNILSGYIPAYSPLENLINIDRNKINFNEIIKGSKQVEIDTKHLSEKGIEVYDVLFNILYKNGKFNIIDTCSYFDSELELEKLYNTNISIFNYSVLEFIIKDTFYEFVFSSKELKEFYNYVENGESIIDFLRLLKQRLSEFCDKEITTVKSAKKAIKLEHHSVYPAMF